MYTWLLFSIWHVAKCVFNTSVHLNDVQSDCKCSRISCWSVGGHSCADQSIRELVDNRIPAPQGFMQDQIFASHNFGNLMINVYNFGRPFFYAFLFSFYMQ